MEMEGLLLYQEDDGVGDIEIITIHNVSGILAYQCGPYGRVLPCTDPSGASLPSEVQLEKSGNNLGFNQL